MADISFCVLKDISCDGHFFADIACGGHLFLRFFLWTYLMADICFCVFSNISCAANSFFVFLVDISDCGGHFVFTFFVDISCDRHFFCVF